MRDPIKPVDLTVLDKAFGAYQAGSPWASWIFGTALVAFFIYIFFKEPNPTPTQCDIIRFLMALTAGLFFFFFVGGVALHGKLKGVALGAGGGAAMFVLMQFLVDPVPGCTGRLQKDKVWNGGQQLGQLIDTLRRQRAAGEKDIPRIEVSSADEDQITHFDAHLNTVTGKTWAELFQRICDSTNGCLVCDISKDQQIVRLSARGTWSRTAIGRDPTKYAYSCK